MSPPTLFEEVGEFRSGVSETVRVLQSIIAQLELIPIASSVRTLDKPLESATEVSNKVFIVYGHDEPAKETVARFVERLGLEAMIISEQASAGRTLIEQVEHYSDVAYAVVLLTPDDLGAAQRDIKSVVDAAKDNQEGGRVLLEVLKPRPRQNVILELGFFYGRLQRKGVCALLAGGVEWPSDIHGVVYVSMDEGDWRLRLAKEMKEAGLTIDLNRAM